MPEELQRPKGCEGCKKPCTVFFTKIVNGETMKLGMCADCPFAKSLLNPAQSGLLSLFAGMPGDEVATGEKCPVCGFTPADFQKTSRLGCPHCYEYLSRLVGAILAKVQPGTEHHGKSPRHHEGALAKSRIASARAELDAAVLREDFESAAKLRDEIRSLEAKIAAAENPPRVAAPGPKTPPPPAPPADSPPKAPPPPPPQPPASSDTGKPPEKPASPDDKKPPA